MEVIKTEIPDVMLLKPRLFGDHRGSFRTVWSLKKLAEEGIKAQFVEEHHVRGVTHTLSGLYYQVDPPQGMLVRAVGGEIFCVAVDFRQNSSTIGKWVGVALSAHNKQQLWIPPGFAHGFYVPNESSEWICTATQPTVPDQQCVIRWNDPEINIQWPIPRGSEPLLSNDDTRGEPFRAVQVSTAGV